MMERLTKHKFGNVVSENQEKTGIHCSNFCNNCSQGTGDCKHLKAMVEKLAAYEDAEEQGLLLKLPIPIGTTVYKFEPLASGKKEYIKTRVSRYDVFDDSVWFCFLNGLGRNIEDFGKYVFLTQAEAEQKLKEMKS